MPPENITIPGQGNSSMSSSSRRRRNAPRALPPPAFGTSSTTTPSTAASAEHSELSPVITPRPTQDVQQGQSTASYVSSIPASVPAANSPSSSASSIPPSPLFEAHRSDSSVSGVSSVADQSDHLTSKPVVSAPAADHDRGFASFHVVTDSMSAVSTVSMAVYMSTAGGTPSHQPTSLPVTSAHPSFPVGVASTQAALSSTNPMTLLPAPNSSQVEGTRLTYTNQPNPLASTMARDALLAYAHSLYNYATSPTPGLPPPVIPTPFFLPILLHQNRASLPASSVHLPSGRLLPQSQRSNHLSGQLVPLLGSLQNLHPNHLPTLLLQSCVYFALGDYDTSLKLNAKILRIDRHYVEALSNIGTTLRALGRIRDCEIWWYMAIRLQPIYWDAVDNLIGALCALPRAELGFNPHSWLEVKELQALSDPWHEPSGISYVYAHHDPSARLVASKLASPGVLRPQFHDALEVCNFVQTHALGQNNRPSLPIPVSQLFRLQNLMYTAGNLRHVVSLEAHHSRPQPRIGEYPSGVKDLFRAVEIALRPRGPSNPTIESEYTTRDLIVAVCLFGLIARASPRYEHIEKIAPVLGYHDAAALVGSASNSTFNFLGSAHHAGDALVEVLLQIGGGVIPIIFMLPEDALRLAEVLFREWNGVAPSLNQAEPRRPFYKLIQGVDTQVVNKTHQTTSTALLALARLFQEQRVDIAFHHPGGSNGPRRDQTTNVQIRATPSLALLFYYIALSLFPSASVCNNMGILIASMGVPVEYSGGSAGGVLDGHSLARAYYVRGLSMDATHPHLLTNLGSLLKDEGMTSQAIQLYTKAIEIKPDFDVALANLANANKDLGRLSEAAEYYQRAVAISPFFPEAVSGLGHAMNAICDWRGRGNLENGLYIDPFGRLLDAQVHDEARAGGWMDSLITICQEQIARAYSHGAGVMAGEGSLDHWLALIERCIGSPLSHEKRRLWILHLKPLFSGTSDRPTKRINEASVLIRLVESMMRIVQRRWYADVYGLATRASIPFPAVHRSVTPESSMKYFRPRIPSSLSPPTTVSVLPFHTFTYPLSPRTARLVAHRNAVRISYSVLQQTALPPHVYPPPAPPSPRINIGYVSSDINNHPLSHLMQTAFKIHDPTRFNVFIYALAPSDGSAYRHRIQSEARNFRDVSDWTTQRIAEQVVTDEIHILVNLNGYTKGARNDVFAARPAPIQISLMGFAGTLAAGWCDYLVTDTASCPPHSGAPERWLAKQRSISDGATQEYDLDEELNPESISEEWSYTEKFIYMPHTFFVTDHQQSFPNLEERFLANNSHGIWLAEEERRAILRRELFPDLAVTTTIFANFSQLYKIDPTIFAAWLRILARVPDSILWLLRFPAAGEVHLLRQAALWGGDAIAHRIRFTDVARKEVHIERGRVADVFLDTSECSAHTIAADVLWSGTPIVTWPRHELKMCSRVGASLARATGFGDQMVVSSLSEYEQRAVSLAESISYVWTPNETQPPVLVPRAIGTLAELRRNLYLNRSRAPLFDTYRWTRNIEKGYEEAWRRWVHGTEFQHSEEWDTCQGHEKLSSSIWIADADPFFR